MMGDRGELFSTAQESSTLNQIPPIPHLSPRSPEDVLSEPCVIELPMLSVEGISKRFRGLRAVDDVSFMVPAGKILALIGPNGAGKTTIFNLIAGMFAPDQGRVRLLGRDITGLQPHQICAAGVGRTFQLVKPFGALTVEENVVVGALQRCAGVAAARTEARRILDRLGLGDKAGEAASSLTLAEKKRLETARALATGPKLLLLDEVMAGLRPIEIDAMV